MTSSKRTHLADKGLPCSISCFWSSKTGPNYCMVSWQRVWDCSYNGEHGSYAMFGRHSWFKPILANTSIQIIHKSSLNQIPGANISLKRSCPSELKASKYHRVYNMLFALHGHWVLCRSKKYIRAQRHFKSKKFQAIGTQKAHPF